MYAKQDHTINADSSSAYIQPQLEIGKEDDEHEKEANHVADKVMRMSDGDEGKEKKKMTDGGSKVQLMVDTPLSVRKMSDGNAGGMAAPQKVEQGINSSKGSGQSLPEATKNELGGKMGADFSSVTIHTDSNAVQMNKEIGAKAFTHGNDIYFNQGQYNPSSNEGKHLLAHELTHTVQQGGGVNRKIQRAIDTLGGKFVEKDYVPQTDVVGGVNYVGASIELKFTPNDLVVADNIGLTQSVKTLTNTRKNAAVTVPDFTGPVNKKTSLTTGDKGRSIDQTAYNEDATGKSTGLPQTSPMYAANNQRTLDAHGKVIKADDKVSATLTDVPADANYGTFGNHKKKLDGTFENPVDATMGDAPSRSIDFPGQMYQQSFEVSSLILDGPMKGTYLGSIGWGWKSDVTGTVVTLDPDPISLISTGTATSDFMDAAKLWNASKFKDTKLPKTEYDSVDLPVTTVSSGKKLPSDMTISEIIRSIDKIKSELPTLQPTDKLNKEFEKSALEAGLNSHTIAIGVTVNSTEDITGADDVYVKAISGGRSFVTKTKSMNDHSVGEFLINLSDLIPLGDEIRIEVYDEDSLDSDDLIVNMTWKSPFEEGIINGSSLDGADYKVVLTTKK